MPAVFLVRHGRPSVDPTVPAARWGLDPAGFDDVWALRDRLPARAVVYCSVEPKAVATAELLTDGEVGVVEGLHELERPAGWLDDFDDAVRRCLEREDEPAVTGWETAAACRGRVVRAVEPLLEVHPGEDVLLVGHGTAWTLLAAHLTGRPVDVDGWSRLRTPDVIEVEH